MAGTIIYFVQVFMYSPRQLDTQKIAGELSDLIIEGNQDIRGIRYVRTVLDASATQFSYTYGYPTPSEQLSVRFRWEPSDKHIYRSTSIDGGITWSQEAAIPYYISSVVSIDGKDTSGIIFTYRQINDAVWSGVNLADIRRVIISINVRNGTGSFSDFQGSVNLTASAEIKRFQ